jgi:drug/metabolite transporter (DMT)-like permease
VLAVALSLASSVSWGISDFMGGLQSRKHHVLVVVLLSQAAGLILAFVALPVFQDHPMGSGDLALAAAAGAAGAIGLIGFYGAMSIGTISVVTPIAAMGVVVPVAVGLARGEQPSAIQLIGIAVAMVAVVVISYENDAERRSVELRSVALAVVAALGFGTFFVGVDAVASTDTANTVAAVRIGGVAIALTAVAIVRPSFAGIRKALPIIAVIGFFDVFANGLFAVASTKGLLSLVAVGGSLYPAFTIMLAYLVLHERLTPLRQAGVALALLGVVMIASGA